MSAIAILDLQLALIRTQGALDRWDLAGVTRELAFMKRVRRLVDWPPDDARLLDAFDSALTRTTEAVSRKDTTRLGAANTSLAQAIEGLRDSLYQ